MQPVVPSTTTHLLDADEPIDFVQGHLGQQKIESSVRSSPNQGDAVTCFCKRRRAKDNNGRKLFREAERWIRSRDDGWAFSFQSVCDVLGLNSQHLRVSLIECVYADVAELVQLANEDRGVGERRARQLRHTAGSRLKLTLEELRKGTRLDEIPPRSGLGLARLTTVTMPCGKFPI